MMGAIVNLVGVAVALYGSVLAARSALLLVGRGRPRRGPTPAFIIAGPYLRSRNPLYTGVLVALAGVALATRSAELALGVAVAVVAAHVFVVRVEEPRLLTRFGDAYAAYLTAVPRWLPSRRRPADQV